MAQPGIVSLLLTTDHDHDDVKVGPGRLVFGALFLGLASTWPRLSLAVRHRA